MEKHRTQTAGSGRAGYLTRMTMLLLAAIALFLLVAIPYLPDTTPPQEVMITVEKSLCFPNCAKYRVTIYGDGKVVYQGLENVTVAGERTTHIPKRKVRQLVAAFERIGFCELPGDHGILATDAPFILISLTLEGRYKQVRMNGIGVPQELVDLVHQIDKTVNVERWVGKN